MSKRWKIIIGAVVGVVVVGAILVGLAGFMRSQNQNFRAVAGQPQRATQLEVQLIDDDGDGVPDRGVVELPAARPFERDFGPGQRFGRSFEPGRPAARFPARRFGPFFIIGGLIRLAVLAGVVVGSVLLGMALFRRWGSSPTAPTPPEAATPPETEAEVAEPSPIEPAPTEAEREAGADEAPIPDDDSSL